MNLWSTQLKLGVKFRRIDCFPRALPLPKCVLRCGKAVSVSKRVGPIKSKRCSRKMHQIVRAFLPFDPRLNHLPDLFCAFSVANASLSSLSSRRAVQPVLGAPVGRLPAPGDRHLHEARLARRRAHQLLPGPVQGGGLAGLAGRPVAQRPEWVHLAFVRLQLPPRVAACKITTERFKRGFSWTWRAVIRASDGDVKRPDLHAPSQRFALSCEKRPAMNRVWLSNEPLISDKELKEVIFSQYQRLDAL